MRRILPPKCRSMYSRWPAMSFVGRTIDVRGCQLHSVTRLHRLAHFPRVITARRLHRLPVLCATSDLQKLVSAILIRRATAADAKAIAAICSKAFEIDILQNVRPDAGFAAQLGGVIANAVEADVERQVTSAVEGKKQAAQEARLLLLDRQARSMRAQIAAMKEGRILSMHTAFSPSDRTQLQRLRKRRMCTGFVAQERASGALIGCAFASFMAAEAALPPPWPTSKPARFYMSNLAVLPEHRRRGAALALLQACELLGRRWGEDSMWLHTNKNNTGAIALYKGAGYEVCSERPDGLLGVFTGGRDLLLKKDLPKWRSPCARGEVVSVTGEKKKSNGTYVWDPVVTRY